MKFFSTASIISLAAVAVAVPTVDLVERQGGSTAIAQACTAKGGETFCCDPAKTSTAGLLGLIPQISCLGVLLVNIDGDCNSGTICCNGANDSPSNQLIAIFPDSDFCPQIINL